MTHLHAKLRYVTSYDATSACKVFRGPSRCGMASTTCLVPNTPCRGVVSAGYSETIIISIIINTTGVCTATYGTSISQKRGRVIRVHERDSIVCSAMRPGVMDGFIVHSSFNK